MTSDGLESTLHHSRHHLSRSASEARLKSCDCSPRQSDGVTYHNGNCALVRLSPEARARINAKMDSVKWARNHAMAHAHEMVIG